MQARRNDSLLNHVELLAAFPHMGAPMHGRAGIREILHTPIRIYYRIHEDRNRGGAPVPACIEKAAEVSGVARPYYTD
jgi:plasmid stabilization system protein ParE